MTISAVTPELAADAASASRKLPPMPPQAVRQLAGLPTPAGGLPLVGQMLQIDRLHLHQQLEAWAAELGPAYRLRIGLREFLVVADPDAIAAALRDRPQTTGRTARLVEAAREMGFEGVFAANGELWRRQRPMVMAGFDPRHIRQYFPQLLQVTERFTRRWQRAAAAGQTIVLQDDLMRYTVDVIAGLAFGADVNTLEGNDDIIQRHLDQIFPALFERLLSPIRLPNWLPTARKRKLAQHVAALHEATAGFIAAARARLAAEPVLREQPRTLIEAMLVARDTPESGLTDQDVVGNVLTMLLAGEDTTANTLGWMIHLLAHNPEALARAQAEVRGVLGNARLPATMEQMAALDYVEACCHETMRLKPVAPLIVQQTYLPTVVAGVALPAGALMMLVMRGGALDGRHFAQPLAFEPARWLVGSGGDASSAKRVAMPFGAGPRICPGRYLALLEMKMVMAMLLANFEIDSVDAPTGGEAEERLEFTMFPVGLTMRLRERGAD